MKLIALEKYLQTKILPDLKKGRPGFDAPHTLEVIEWIKRILEHEPKLSVDRAVLLIAGYAHDWGYSGMFEHHNTLQIQEVIDAKHRHMQLGAQKTKNLLNNSFFSFLNANQKRRSIHLVAVHDALDMLKDPDELILMEADTLSGLDVVGKSQFDPASNKRFMEAVKKTRIPLFITTFGKHAATQLFQKRLNWYRNN